MNIICRCCLRKNYTDNDENGTTMMHNIFEEKINEKLIRLFNINININDSLPHTICIECKNKVEECYSFKILCTNSDQKLRALCHYQNQNNDFQQYQQEANIEITSDLLKDKTRIDNSSLILTETIDSYSTSLYESSSTLVNNNGIKNSTSEINLKNNYQYWEELANSSKDYVITNDKTLIENFYENTNKTAIIKKYKCKICNKIFLDNDLIAHHIETVHMQFENINEAKTQKFCNKNENHNESNLIKVQIENFDNQPAVNELTNCLNNIFQDETVSLQTVELVQLYNSSENNDPLNTNGNLNGIVCIKNLNEMTIEEEDNGKNINLDEYYSNNNCNYNEECVIATQDNNFEFDNTISIDKNDLNINFIDENDKLNSTINNISKDVIIRDELKFQCEVCKIELNSMTACHEHIKITHPYITNRYLCKFCSKSFKSASNRNQHERLHRETKDYHCLDCDKDFKTASQYINHKKTHAFRYECRECDKVYVYGQSLKHHYKTIHPESYENMMNTCSLKRGYECEICSKVYESRLSFLAHKRFDHNWAKIFKCRESSCNKKFFNKEQCDLHYKKKHIKEKSLKCQYCNKSFFMKCHLLVHVKKHTNEKNFKCEYCGRGFIQKIHLKTHLAKHTGLREFICTQQNCNKSFTSSTYLKKHKFMAHSEGLMKFKCNICGEGFPMLFVLNKHKKKHEK